MLDHLALNNVGPAPEMDLNFARRVNLVTGDNGLGKSFLLDVVWWSLTGRWPREVNRRMTSRSFSPTPWRERALDHSIWPSETFRP